MSYARVPSTKWTADFRRWPKDSKILDDYIRTGLAHKSEGLFRCPPAWMLDTGLEQEEVSTGLKDLEARGRILFDDEHEVVLDLDALKNYQPKGPKQIQGALTALASVPDTALLAKFYELAEAYAPGLARAIRGQYVATIKRQDGTIEETPLKGDPRYPFQYPIETVSDTPSIPRDRDRDELRTRRGRDGVGDGDERENELEVSVKEALQEKSQTNLESRVGRCHGCGETRSVTRYDNRWRCHDCKIKDRSWAEPAYEGATP
jgi:hypothetical protein